MSNVDKAVSRPRLFKKEAVVGIGIYLTEEHSMLFRNQAFIRGKPPQHSAALLCLQSRHLRASFGSIRLSVES